MKMFKISVLFLFVSLIITLTTNAKPIKNIKLDKLKVNKELVKVHNERKNITHTTTSTKRSTIKTAKLSGYAIRKLKTLGKLRYLKYKLKLKPTEEPKVIATLNTISIDYQSIEVSTYKSGEYDDEFTEQLIKQINILNDLRKLYEVTTKKF